MNRKDIIKKYRENGLVYEEIGKILNISKQRVHQILTGYISPSSFRSKVVKDNSIIKYKYKYKKPTQKIKEYQKEYQKVWRANNKDKRIMYRHNRRTIEKELDKSYKIFEWEDLKKKYNYICLCCKKKEPEIRLTIDHIVPISLKGNNTIDNIQPLCANCNSSKHTKIIDYR